MSLHGFSYTICDFATNKTEKKYEVSQTFKPNTELSHHWQYSSFKWRNKQKKSRIGLLHRKPICRRHPINLNNNITDISQKKICQKALKTQNLSLIFVIQTMKFRPLNLKSWSCQLYTRCTKYFWMTSKTVIQINHVFLSGGNQNASDQKLTKTTIIPSKISSANECKPSHSFPDLSSLKFFEHE